MDAPDSRDSSSPRRLFLVTFSSERFRHKNAGFHQIQVTNLPHQDKTLPKKQAWTTF